MKYKHILPASLILVLLPLVGCQSKITVSGVIIPINDLDIPRRFVVDVIFFDAATEETKQVSAHVNRSGRFTARVPGDELYLFSVSTPRDDLILSTDWIENHPPLLKIGDRLSLTDLFLSYPFELTVEYEDSVMDTIEDLRVSWAPVEAAQLYAVSLMSMGDKRELASMFVTKEPHFIGTESAPTIPFDRVMTIEELREVVPFYRIREELESGHYELWIRAIRETNAGFESVISRSNPLSLQIRE